MKRIKRGVFFLLSFVTILICLRILIGLLLREAPQILTPDEETLRTRALRLHHNATEVDTHNDVPTWILDFGFDLGMDGDEKGDRYPFLYYREGPFHWLPGRPHGENVGTHTDLARIREDGLDAEFFSIWVDRSDYENGEPGQARQRAFDMIEALQKSVRRNPNDIEFAFTALDLERIVSEGKLAAFMGLEGGHAIEDDLKTLGHFYDLGVRYMTLTHNCSHGWADSSTDSPVNDGLSEFGREVVREMNRPGMIVDVSHVSDKTFWDVLEVTSAPIIASHSNCRAIADHPRNMTDGMIRAVADNNGVVVVNFMTPFLDSKRTEYWKILTGWHMFSHPQHPETPLSLLIDQIEHVVQVAGIDHVGGLGSDFDGIPFLPKGLQDVGDLPNITVELVRRGYSEDDIRKILGGNVIRVLAEVERIAVVKADSVTH